MKTSDPTEQLNNKTVLSLLKATDRIQRHFTEILRSRGLTIQQYNALRILRGAGPKGLPILEIGDRLIEKTPGISRLIERLVRRGLVRRARCDEDGRRMLCTLTHHASELLAQLDDPITKGDAECLTGLTAEERGALQGLTSRILPET